jgi:hypothetical protein
MESVHIHQDLNNTPSSEKKEPKKQCYQFTLNLDMEKAKNPDFGSYFAIAFYPDVNGTTPVECRIQLSLVRDSKLFSELIDEHHASRYYTESKEDDAKLIEHINNLKEYPMVPFLDVWESEGKDPSQKPDTIKTKWTPPPLSSHSKDTKTTSH